MVFGALLVAALVVLRLAAALARSRPRTAAGLAAAAVAALALAATDPPSGYTLRKTVGLLLMPVGLIWLGVLAAAAIAFETRRLRLGSGLLALGLVLALAGNPIIGAALVGTLERPYEAIDPMAEGPFDAVLVLGGGVTRDRAGRLAVDDAADRIILPVRLFLAGRCRQLVVSGPWVTAWDGTVWSYPELVAGLWVELGVPTERIVRLEGPTSTSDEAEAYAALIARTGWTRLGVVTSAFHMRRGLHNLRRHGVDARPLPCDFRNTPGARDLRALVPQASGFMTAQLAAWELVGSLAGR